jgi:23S rRNA (guanine2445-N2)-methyltransferase / 23S rRNA (guanine2069-N7)-methyltransferase
VTDTYDFFATAPRGMEPLLADELRVLGAGGVAETRAGVAFTGPLAIAYRVCLWSRVANRVLLSLATFAIASADDLYDGVQTIDWSDHLVVDGTLAVDFISVGSPITHTHYGALKLKDGVVDQFRERSGVRPSVETTRPDVRINVFAHRDTATVSIDLSGESLHRRGYREPGVQVGAPLKENLAAALLLRVGWPQIAAAGGSLVDPLCGSGTLPLEAALIAADIAPGLACGVPRPAWGFLGWRGHDGAAWDALVDEAIGRRAAGLPAAPPIIGYDHDARAVAIALANAGRAGLAGVVHIERRELAALERPARAEHGLVIANPPYGERLGDSPAVEGVYTLLGERLRTRFTGWRAGVLAADREIGRLTGLRARKVTTFYNGALQCSLLDFEISEERFLRGGARPPPAARAASPQAEMFANRLRKNERHLGKQMRRTGVTCYRVYDADLPDYSLAIDIYEGFAHVQEYAPPPEIDSGKAAARLEEAMLLIPQVLEIPAERVFLKVRQRQRGAAQYDRQATLGEFYIVHEGDCGYLVNFSDYLDTGLFLDQRITRQLIREECKGRRFLNLFGYTGTASVNAAKGGAASTTTVDLSRAYLDWAQRNLELNGLKPARNELVRADCLEWIAEAGGSYDFILVDPPTFSNSKRMGRQTFDVQRDHADLIGMTARRLLAPGGTLLFATNSRRFRLDQEALAGYRLEDLSKATLPADFARSPRMHTVWRITAA